MTGRILIVDDEPALRRTLERALKGHGYEVLSVADPHSAYQILGESVFDLVLLDLRLPQMAGDTLFLAIVRRWPRMLRRVILMSGDAVTQHPDWPAELSECPVLHKPFSLDDLMTTVQEVLASAESDSNLKEGNGNP
ncbi:MAG TPA: response regulator [Gemmatimonadales bacterium]|nr:response regulator [Gemmatimonadales bacterium]